MSKFWVLEVWKSPPGNVDFCQNHSRSPPQPWVQLKDLQGLREFRSKNSCSFPSFFIGPWPNLSWRECDSRWPLWGSRASCRPPWPCHPLCHWSPSCRWWPRPCRDRHTSSKVPIINQLIISKHGAAIATINCKIQNIQIFVSSQINSNNTFSHSEHVFYTNSKLTWLSSCFNWGIQTPYGHMQCQNSKQNTSIISSILSENTVLSSSFIRNIYLVLTLGLFWRALTLWLSLGDFLSLLGAPQMWSI